MKMRVTVLAVLMAVAPQTRATINRALRPGDFEVVWAADASEAVEVSARCRPDLVVLDLDEPLQKLKERGVFEQLRTANPRAPVVVLADHGSEYDGALVGQVGAVLQKPVGAAALAETVKALLKLPPGDVGLPAGQDTGLGAVTAESEAFRAMLIERNNAPYELVPSYRHWGINE